MKDRKKRRKVRETKGEWTVGNRNRGARKRGAPPIHIFAIRHCTENGIIYALILFLPVNTASLAVVQRWFNNKRKSQQFYRI